MAEIEITLPTVQFGNVKVRATPQELGLDSISDASALGIGAAIYLNLFTQGFKTGSQMDVKAPSGASQGPSVPEAQVMLDEGLGGVTELSEEGEYDSATEAKEAAQARSAPWDEPAVDSKTPPWETESKPEVVAALSDW